MNFINDYLNFYSLLIAVIVGFLLSISVLFDSLKFKGGALEKVYIRIGVGMVVILLSMSLLLVTEWDFDLGFMKLHDVMFITGYLIIALGTKSIIKIIKGKE